MFINKKILKEIKDINEKLDKYILSKDNKRKIVIYSFLGGISRGIGIAIGVVLLGAVIIMILKRWISLPIIGKYIAELLKIVETYLAK